MFSCQVEAAYRRSNVWSVIQSREKIIDYTGARETKSKIKEKRDSYRSVKAKSREKEILTAVSLG